MHKIMRRLLILVCLQATMLTLAQDRADKLKAVFLFKFTSYVSWPEGPAKTLCSYAGVPFGGLLEQVKNLTKSSLDVQHIPQGSSLGQCDLAYLPTNQALAFTAGQAILTVSDVPGFAKAGGMIELRKEAKRIKIVVNLKQLEGAGLRASARFLDLAEVMR